MIYDAKDISKQVFDAINYYHSNYIAAAMKASKTKEELRKEVKNDFEEENKQLKNTLSLAVVFLSSEKELKAYNKFCEKHRQICMVTKDSGGKVPYVKQFGCGVGTITKVYCQVCGEHEDITDTSVW